MFQGLLFTTPECLKSPVDLVRLWLHEASRVYGDKLVDGNDMESFAKIKLEIAKSNFEVYIITMTVVLDMVEAKSVVCTYVHRIWTRLH